MNLFIKNTVLTFLLIYTISIIHATQILIPMDENKQINHLKAYGVAYWILQNDIEVEWLLNYRGGSFLVKNYQMKKMVC